MPNLINALEKYQATIHTVALNLHNLHWNLEDPTFYSLHPYLGDLYDQVNDLEDEVAEQLRFMNARPLTTLDEIKNISEAEDIASQSFDAKLAIKLALADINTLYKSASTVVAEADRTNTWAAIEKFSAHLVAYEKIIYFLRSSSKLVNEG